jgi:tryptophan synthase alpha chain
MIPPTIADTRIKHIVQIAAQGHSSFIYCVSLSGVTGSRTEVPPQLRSFIARVYGYTKEYNLPLAVGFGLSTPAHIAEVTSYADGAAVGSALVNLIDQHPENEQPDAVKTYIASLRM